MNGDSTNLEALVSGETVIPESATAVDEPEAPEETNDGVILEEENTEAEQPQIELTTLSWAIPLANAEGDGQNTPIEFTEFDKSAYRFEEVYDPDGNPTGMFTTYFKDLTLDEPRWEILRAGLLSDQYVAARVEKFYTDLASQVDFVGTPIVTWSPFRLNLFGNTGTAINPLGDDDNKLAFEIISGIDSAELSNANTHVQICVSNSYNGAKNISLDYIVHISLSGPNTRTLNFRDFFTLTNQSHYFTHRTYSLGDVSSRLVQVPEQYMNALNVLKSVTQRVDQHVSKTSKLLRKAERNILLEHWEQIPADHKNMLMFVILLSYCLDLNYSVVIHQNLRSYIGKEISRIFRSQL